MRQNPLRSLTIATVLLAAIEPALATWSIVLVDTSTKEVAVGSATCVLSRNLKNGLPVFRVGVGAAAAQASTGGRVANIALIWRELANRTDPNEILNMLAARDGAHQTRQYGIVDVRGRAATFTGNQDGAWAGGVTGSIGTIVYAIQGNVMTGAPVVLEAERALRQTPGAIPEKLMAAMEAAYSMGGDGRCSCRPNNPTGCGSPPPNFDKSAHNGFMILARLGDDDGNTTCSGGTTCAGGNYYLKINVKRQGRDDVDPVLQMRERFDVWRASLVGAPDAIESTAALSANHVLNDGSSEVTLRIELRDWQRGPATELLALRVTHDPHSAGSSTIGPVVDLGNGSFEVRLTAGSAPGRDRFLVAAEYPDDDDADTDNEQAMLIPVPELLVQDAAADLNADRVVDLADLSLLLSSFGAGNAGDVDGDGDTDLTDLARLLGSIAPL